MDDAGYCYENWDDETELQDSLADGAPAIAAAAAMGSGEEAESYAAVRSPDGQESGTTGRSIFETLDLAQVNTLLTTSAERMASLTQLSVGACMLIIQGCKASQDLISEYFEDASAVLARVGLDTDVAGHTNTLESNASAVECAICTDTVAPGKARCLSACRHFFCLDCWRDHIVHALDTGANVLSLRCPAHNCAELVDMHNALALITRGGSHTSKNGIDGDECHADKDALRDKVWRGYAAAFVNASPRLCWCPNERSCSGIVHILPGVMRTQAVRCARCGLEFCFACKRPPHQPASCQNMEEWERLRDDGGMNVATILTNTKKCPKCHMDIEKNMGCNHMTCWRNCRYEFCWICLKKWDNYAHVCSKGDASAAKSSEVVIAERFKNNFEAYLQHLNSCQLESARIQAFLQSIDVLVPLLTGVGPTRNAARILAHELLEMSRVLRKARRLLACAYVYGYFIKDDEIPSARLRCHARWKLQVETENLSNYLNLFSKQHWVSLDELVKSIALVSKWAERNLFE